MSKKNTKNELPVKQSRALREDVFWNIIAKAHTSSAREIIGDEYSEREDYYITHLITELLRKRSLKSVIQFEIRLRVLMWQDRSEELSESISKILGKEYDWHTEKQFMLWLISQGEKVYKSAIKNPKALVKKPKYFYDLFEGDAILRCTFFAFHLRSGGKRVDDFIDELEARRKYDTSYTLFKSLPM